MPLVINTNVKHQFIHIDVDFVEWVIFVLISMSFFHTQIIVSVNITSSFFNERTLQVNPISLFFLLNLAFDLKFDKIIMKC